VKPNLLPPTDVANYAALESASKWKALVHFHAPPVPPVSYAPFRDKLDDCLGLRAGVFDLARVDLSTIELEIIRACARKTELNITANLQVARATVALAQTRKIGGIRAPELAPRTMGGHVVEPWNRMALDIDSRLVIPFFDPRRKSTRLGALGKRVAFSIMHENIRVVHPDYADARLAIVQFADVEKGERTANLTYDDGIDLIPYGDLVRMIGELYEMYDAVCAGREDDARRHADDVPDDELPPLARLWRR
jgi:hypothetical protein